MHLWKDRIYQIIAENPTWSETEITWQLIEEMGIKGASLLYPVFEREGGKKGRLSIQTNPALYRTPKPSPPRPSILIPWRPTSR